MAWFHFVVGYDEAQHLDIVRTVYAALNVGSNVQTTQCYDKEVRRNGWRI